MNERHASMDVGMSFFAKSFVDSLGLNHFLMQGLMMDYQLTVPTILRRAETYYPNKPIVTRQPDKSLHRYTYKDFSIRAKKLGVALQQLGIQEGDRVATLSWNHHQHLEVYFGTTCCGFVLHTLNLRLSGEDLAYIVNHAEDAVIIVDQVLLPLLESFKSKIQPRYIIVIPHAGQPIKTGYLDYEKLLAASDEKQFEYFNGNENCAAALCYTTGTTGQPKGVLYSHRSIMLHSIIAFAGPIGIRDEDVVMPVVPMFHVNAWGLPFTSLMVGSSMVFPGPFLDATSLLELLEKEQVTVTAGVPTIWLGILNILDAQPDKYKLSKLRSMIVGGSAAPRAMIVGFQERHNLTVIHAWGMTETSPAGTVCEIRSELQSANTETQYDYRAKQGMAALLVEMRIRNEDGIAPWDGKAMGELEVRGPWIAEGYFQTPEDETKFTEDGWFRTGDIATIDEMGYMEIKDRSKDVIKSGGEWISSVALESALMGHPAVAEAAVFAIPNEKWGERPMACVVLKEGRAATAAELNSFLEPHFAKFQLPDVIAFVADIPKTSVGKFKKSVLREQYGKV